jgi:branched-subunit amino acid transport protein
MLVLLAALNVMNVPPVALAWVTKIAQSVFHFAGIVLIFALCAQDLVQEAHHSAMCFANCVQSSVMPALLNARNLLMMSVAKNVLKLAKNVLWPVPLSFLKHRK